MAEGRMTGKTVVVSGGARGIGLAVARRLAAEDARVVIADVSSEGEGVARGLGASRGRSLYAAHDVREEGSWDDLVTLTTDRFGELHGLVNAAGVARRAALEELGLQEWQEVMAVNAAGCFLGMKYCASQIAADGGGAVVNLSSVAGITGLPSYTAYSSSKGSVQAMTRIAAMEYARRGVRVNAVLPGSVDTDMLRYDASYVGLSPEDFRAALGARVPLGRVAQPEDIAPAVTFLLSEDARYITGAELVVDGGLSAGTAG